jgi:SAM-dependent methyltransferase
MNRKEHWEHVYRSKSLTALSWYQPDAVLSFRLIGDVAPDKETPVIDVGGGASVLTARLRTAGYTRLTVLDISGSALDAARAALGPDAGSVRWIEGDILTADLPPAAFGVWHDRAAFHFLTDVRDRKQYVVQTMRGVAPGGYLIVAAFADDGPIRCSGLDVVRYSPAALGAEFAAGFTFMRDEREEHVTPAGVVQAFTCCVFRRKEPAEEGDGSM